MAEIDLNKQMEKTATFKDTILKRIKETESIFEKRDNDLLAAVLYKYYGRDNYDSSTITEDDYIGNKSKYIEFLASDKESVKKAITENKRVYEKHKTEIKNSIIDFLKFKAELYSFNKKAIEELENEITVRKKQACKLNELIIGSEKEVENLEQNLEQKQSEYKQIDEELNEVTAKISELDNKLFELTKQNNPDKSVEIENINSELLTFLAKKSNLEKSLVQSSQELVKAENNFTSAESKLTQLHIDLDFLNIEDYENKLKTVKEGNEHLKETIDKDRDEFAALGYDITAQDIINSSTPSKSPDAKDNSDNTKSSQPTQKTQGNAQQQVSNVTPQQQSNLPVTQTPAQRAQSLKSQLLDGTDEDARNLIADGTNFSGLIDSISNYNYNNKDKKRLMDRVGKLNSPLDVNKLSNVISAISRSGYCSGIDISNMFDKNGMLKDFSQLSNDDIDNLNNFINEVSENKDFIDDEQLGFLKNNFINNIKCNSLKQSLKPKRLRDFIKSKNAREQDKVRFSKLSCLAKTISSPAVSAKKVETSSKNSSFLDALTGNTIPPQQQTVQQATTNQPPQQTGLSR